MEESGLSVRAYIVATTIVLNILRNILGGDWGLCSIFGILGGGPPELLLHDAEAARDLGVVGAVVAQQEGRLAEAGDKARDIHGV
jgi:hypothetical protein